MLLYVSNDYKLKTVYAIWAQVCQKKSYFDRKRFVKVRNLPYFIFCNEDRYIFNKTVSFTKSLLRLYRCYKLLTVYENL